MVARQMTPPSVPLDRYDPFAQEAVLAVRAKLGTKECFPDLDLIVVEVERKTAKVKGPDAKGGILQEALTDLAYVLDSSKAIYQFLEVLGGIDDPEPYYTYFEACELTLSYFRQLFEHVANTDKASAAQTDPSRSDSDLTSVDQPIKPIMNTKEVAHHIRRSVWTVRHYVSDKKIPFHRTSENSFPYFLTPEIDGWVAAGLCPSRRRKRFKAKLATVAPPALKDQEVEEGGGSHISEVVPCVDASAGRRTVIAKMASLLVQACHLDEIGEARLVSWIASGCKALPEEERIDWRTGRKTLCTFIVCAYHASLLPLEIDTKRKSGKPGPLYEKAITSAFLDRGASIKKNMDRTISGPEEAIVRFKAIMNQYTQDSENDPRDEDSLFGDIDDYYARRDSSSFVSYRNQIEAEFDLGEKTKQGDKNTKQGKKKTKIFSEIEEGVMKLFLKLYQDCFELLVHS